MTTSRPATREKGNDGEGVVTSKPRLWLRLDALTLLVASLLLFATTHEPWWLVPLIILLPDVFMVGYLRDTRLGALTYNVGHTYLLPATVTLLALAGHHPLVLAIGLLWLGHIGMDRVLGYGLKYDSAFRHTHLGDLGQTSQTSG